jgi:peptidyl-prolyl cis-trans isomerase C
MSRFPLTAVLAVACWTSSCSPPGEEGQVLAEVGGRKITVQEVDARIAGVPRMSRPEFSGPIGRTRMLRQMIEEEVLYRAAVEDGIDRDESVRSRLRQVERETVVQTYLDRMQEDASRVDDDEARRFYDEHLDDYRIEKMVRVRMLVTPRENVARRVGGMVAEGGLFEDLCGRLSENTFVVSARGLIPTWIRKGRAVPWIGNHPEFHEAAFSLPVNQLSEPLETPAGWIVLRVEEIREERLRPFEEAKEDVVSRISRERSSRGLPQLLAELNERYDVKIHEEPGSKSADELFTEAQAEANPRRRVELYEEIVARFPDFDRLVDAQFMIGFIRSEELRDSLGAAAAFEKVIELAPDSDLAQSARWMLSSGSEEPVFEDDGWTPDSLEASR